MNTCKCKRLGQEAPQSPSSPAPSQKLQTGDFGQWRWKQQRAQTSTAPLQVEGTKEAFAAVPGLIVLPGFISQKEEQFLLGEIEKGEWDSDLKRLCQQFGFKFEHASQHLRKYLGPLPEWCDFLTNRLVPFYNTGTCTRMQCMCKDAGPSEMLHILRSDGRRELESDEKLDDTDTDTGDADLHDSSSENSVSDKPQRRPDQMIINQYRVGQGIHAHVDKVHCFSEVVCSVGLASGCVMNFKHKESGRKVEILFKRRTAVILTGEARYDWTHGISGFSSDKWNGKMLKRKTRVSMTWRLVEGNSAKEKRRIRNLQEGVFSSQRADASASCKKSCSPMNQRSLASQRPGGGRGM